MENTNILKAISNLVKNPISALGEIRSLSSNRANSMGEALEIYVKDIFCGTLGEENNAKKDLEYGKLFSYLGNQNNPPDIMIKGGDAIEVKKHLGNRVADLALNSSYPKDILLADSPMITSECRNCEVWDKKDIIYAIGNIVDQNISSIWFVYGDCYAASKDIYERIRNKISQGIAELPDIELAETVELGRVNRVDPLGVTALRVRGMWTINHPSRVFSYVENIVAGGLFNVNTVMLKTKYDSFSDVDRNEIESIQSDKFKINDIKIKSPNNPAVLLDAKLITYKID